MNEIDKVLYSVMVYAEEAERKRQRGHTLLSKKQTRILDFLYSKRNVKLKKLKKQFNLSDDISIIREINNEYLKISYKNNAEVVNITQEGKAIVQKLRKEAREKKVSNKKQKTNTIIAILSLIAALISIIIALD